MAKKSAKKAPAKKAVEQKVKPAVKQAERNQVQESIPTIAPLKPLSKREIARRKKECLAAQKEAEAMMKAHYAAAKKKKDEEFNAAFKKSENKLEIYFIKDKDGEQMDMRVTGFESPSNLAGVLALMLGKVTGR